MAKLLIIDSCSGCPFYYPDPTGGCPERYYDAAWEAYSSHTGNTCLCGLNGEMDTPEAGEKTVMPTCPLVDVPREISAPQGPLNGCNKRHEVPE